MWDTGEGEPIGGNLSGGTYLGEPIGGNLPGGTYKYNRYENIIITLHMNEYSYVHVLQDTVYKNKIIMIILVEW